MRVLWGRRWVARRWVLAKEEPFARCGAAGERTGGARRVPGHSTERSREDRQAEQTSPVCSEHIWAELIWEITLSFRCFPLDLHHRELWSRAAALGGCTEHGTLSYSLVTGDLNGGGPNNPRWTFPANGKRRPPLVSLCPCLWLNV